MLEYKGTLLGKRIFTYDDKKKCNFDKLIKEYKIFDKIQLLRFFSDLSTELFKVKENILVFSGIPVNVDFINYCILLALKHCTGFKTDISPIERDNILKISHPWYQYEISNNKENPIEYMVKIAYRQFVYQLSLFVIARSIYIYNYLWPLKYNSLFNINNAFLEIYGISYDKVLFYGMALAASNDSYFYASVYKSNFKSQTTIEIQDGDFEKFIKLVSLDDNGFIAYKGSLLNPISKYPILQTDFYPPDMKEPVNLILSKACLFNKIIYGVYYDLLEYNMESNGKNDFKTVFGHVFQEYIGVLLKAHFTKWRITPEIKYSKDKNNIDTIDWFIQRGKNLVAIEVKQSSIYLSAKNEGNIDVLKSNIEQNIIKAIRQLDKTEEDIFSHKYAELEQFKRIENIQRLIIIADPLYLGNLIVNMLFDDILVKTKTHIINISDFESLLDLQKNKESLFYLLESKLEKENINMDFTEFIHKKYGMCRTNNKFLIKHFEKYFRSWGINSAKE
jgi:hypothetical protein